MTALAVIGRIQYWLVVGLGQLALSLSRLMSLNALLKKFSEILCDSCSLLAALALFSGADVVGFTQELGQNLPVSLSAACLCLRDAVAAHIHARKITVP